MRVDPKESRRTGEGPIGKPAFPLPAIYSPKRQTRYSTRPDRDKMERPLRERSATAARN